MAMVYASLVRKGIKTIEEVPSKLRKAVQKILDQENTSNDS